MTVYLNGKKWGEFTAFTREDIKALLMMGASNHVQVYMGYCLLVDIYTADLRNLPNF